MNPRIQSLRARFSPEKPKLRYLSAALVLEGSLVAMSIWLPGSGRSWETSFSQTVQIETAEQVAVEQLADPVLEPEHEVVVDEALEEESVTLTRFMIVDSDPLPLDLPEATKDPAPVDPELLPESWLRRIAKKKERATEPTPSSASVAQVRLEPLEGQSPKPQYPAAAVRLGLEGTIHYRIHVGDQGQVLRLEIVEQDCAEILRRAAHKALMQWRFLGGPGVFDKHVDFSLIDRE